MCRFPCRGVGCWAGGFQTGHITVCYNLLEDRCVSITEPLKADGTTLDSGLDLLTGYLGLAFKRFES